MKNIHVIKVTGPVVKGELLHSTITIRMNPKTASVSWFPTEIDLHYEVRRAFTSCCDKCGMNEALRNWWKRTKLMHSKRAVLYSGGSSGDAEFINQATVNELVSIIKDGYGKATSMLTESEPELLLRGYWFPQKHMSSTF